MNDYLNKSKEILLSEYWDFSNNTERLFEQYDVTLRLPIDIEKVAKTLGFCIKELLKDDEKFSPFYAYVNQEHIILRKGLSYKEKRWAIAKAIAIPIAIKSCLVSDDEINHQIYVPNPLLVSPNVDEFYTDALATLLLLPISLFREEVFKNISQLDMILKILLNKTQMPEIKVATGYELIKQILSFQRNKEFEDANYSVEQISSNQYEDIFI